MWWGIVTMATIWYGDMVPVTVLGKILGTVLILFWPVLLAVVSSITILVFMDVAESQKQILEKICANCHEKNKDDAHYCSYCAGQEFSNITRDQNEKRSNFMRKLFSKK
jgi:voltage-gated potassium channel